MEKLLRQHDGDVLSILTKTMEGVHPTPTEATADVLTGRLLIVAFPDLAPRSCLVARAVFVAGQRAMPSSMPRRNRIAELGGADCAWTVARHGALMGTNSLMCIKDFIIRPCK